MNPFKMSAGLMSCVRENSPPLELNEFGEVSMPEQSATTVQDTQKRRRFHPLRNLRKIFRRRSVSQTDVISPSSSIDDQINERLGSPNLAVSRSAERRPIYGRTKNDSINMGCTSSSMNFMGHHQRRERSVDGGRTNELIKNSERDMTDYKRSFSEDRLIDSEYSRDALSQSHDSVFSESATASSLSIVLKAELTDVLRKRRNRPQNGSDEDLGLPRSPMTPQRKDDHLNQSEASLSMLSTASSDVDDDSLPVELHHNNSLAIFNRPSDEIDLEISTSSAGSNLSHSAAKHKMAIRPKKKGPSRHRKPKEASILPSTPEVNELNATTKHSFADIENYDSNVRRNESYARELLNLDEKISTIIMESRENVISNRIPICQPDGNVVEMLNKKTTSNTTTTAIANNTKSCITETEKTKLPMLSLGQSIEKLNSTTTCNIINNSSSHFPSHQQLISTKAANSVDWKQDESNQMVKTKSYDSFLVNTLSIERKNRPIVSPDRPKSGAASRQRCLPQDRIAHSAPSDYSMNEILLHSPSIVLPDARSIDQNIIKPDSYANTNTYQTENSIFPLTKFIAKIESNKQHDSFINTKHKPVEKAKSFRVYTENGIPRTNHVLNMPSLPDLTKNPKLEHSCSFREVSKFNELSFEINDNKLLTSNATRFDGLDRDHLTSPPSLPPLPLGKNMLVASSKPTMQLQPAPPPQPPQPPTSIKPIQKTATPNILQIEDNIDKIMKSSLTTILRKSSTTDLFEIRSKNNISLMPVNSQSYNDDLGNADNVSYIDERKKSVSSISSILSTQTQSTDLPPKSIPEFLKIQLNRTEYARPKSHVIFTRNPNEIDGKRRRFSNESVEIADYKTPTHITTQITKILSMDSPEAISMALPSNPVKAEPNRELLISSDISTTDAKPKIDSKSIISDIDNNSSNNESRKFEFRKSATIDETNVILRKKSISQIYQKQDKQEDTPELMKVFARRSLKLKDTDDYQLFENVDKITLGNSKSQFIDSDKENQSSSEEKLNKLIVPEANASPKYVSNTVKSEDDAVRKSDSHNTEMLRKNNNSVTKPFFVQNKCSNFRNTTTIIDGGNGKSPFSNKSIEKFSNNSEKRNTLPDVLKIENSGIGAETEFKGILQRRAEWEQRAKEALK